MESNFHRIRVLPLAALLVGVVLTACVNSDYDFDEVDATMGFGGDGLVLPASSTDTIKLLDVLEVDDGGCVVIKPNGDYVFEQRSDKVDPSYPKIDRIEVTRSRVEATDIPVSVTTTGPAGTSGQVNVVLAADGDMQDFKYEGEKPEEVLALESGETNAEFDFALNFPDRMSAVVSTVDEVTIRVPAYMELDNIRASAPYTVSGSTYIFADVPTRQSLTVTADIATLTFGRDDDLGTLAVNGDMVTLEGRVHVTLYAETTVDDGTIDYMTMGSDFNMDDFEITSATGRFNPDIDLTDLGGMDIVDIPDFLDDGNVVIDLYNPQILFTVSSDLTMDGYVSGTLHSIKDGVEIATVEIPEMPVTAGRITSLCICRRADGITGYDYVREVENLSDLIRTIPDRITFDGVARADTSSTTSIELGYEYTVAPDCYTIEAPLTFDTDAKIVYTDTLDGWNSDLKDLNLAEDAYIEVAASIENRVPAYLTLTAAAIDVDGRKMDTNEIEVSVDNTVIASADGDTSVDTPVTVRLSQNTEGVMERLDGLVLTIDGSASYGSESVVGVTLNSERHFLIAKEIKVTLVGRVIGDFN